MGLWLFQFDCLRCVSRNHWQSSGSLRNCCFMVKSCYTGMVSDQGPDFGQVSLAIGDIEGGIAMIIYVHDLALIVVWDF